MNYKIGDSVICTKEDDLPNYVGTIWEVIGFSNNLIFCKNIKMYPQNMAVRSASALEGFPFLENEIVLTSSLIKELV